MSNIIKSIELITALSTPIGKTCCNVAVAEVAICQFIPDLYCEFCIANTDPRDDVKNIITQLVKDYEHKID